MLCISSLYNTWIQCNASLCYLDCQYIQPQSNTILGTLTIRVTGGKKKNSSQNPTTLSFSYTNRLQLVSLVPPGFRCKLFCCLSLQVLPSIGPLSATFSFQ